jgi:hypothetical protein
MRGELELYKLGGKIESETIKLFTLENLMSKLNLDMISGDAKSMIIDLLSDNYSSNLTINDKRVLKLYYNLLLKYPKIKNEATLIDFIAAKKYLKTFGSGSDVDKLAISVIDRYFDKFVQDEADALEQATELASSFESPSLRKIDSVNDIPSLVRKIMPYHQQKVIVGNDEIMDVLLDLEERAKELPPIYSQDSKGKDAIVYLHYFVGGSDWYITEGDIENGEYYGYTILNGDIEMSEFGYISIEELISNDYVELDFFFSKTSVKQAIASTYGE